MSEETPVVVESKTEVNESEIESSEKIDTPESNIESHNDENVEKEAKDLDVSSDYSNISFDETENSKLKEDDDENIEDGGIVPLAKDEVANLTVDHPSTSAIEQSKLPSGSTGDLKKVDPNKMEKLSKSEKELNDLCKNMFSKLENYLKGEVANSVEDYALLERMNRSTTYKYQEMMKVATSVGQSMHEINTKFSHLRPYLEQIEQIEQSVLVLEQAAYKLDGYAKRLEERFRKLEKR